MKKNVFKITVLLLVFTLIIGINFQYVNAALGEGLDNSIYNSVTSEQSTELDNTLYRVVSTIILILQILAMAGVVITGVRYMYAGSEDKAQIKQTLIWMIFGAIFVFAAPSIITFIINTGNNIF